MKRRQHRRAARHAPADINITAFMNLMVILVPFLLITAVFSRITILELNLPASTAQEQPAAKEHFDLEIIVRADGIEVGDRQGGLVRQFARGDTGADLEELSVLLQQIKARFPDKLDATLLLEPEITYDRVVAVMDSIRIARISREGSLHTAELFPEIAVGDAPPGQIKVASSRQGEPR